MSHKASSKFVTFLYLIAREYMSIGKINWAIRYAGNTGSDADGILSDLELAALAERWAKELGETPEEPNVVTAAAEAIRHIRGEATKPVLSVKARREGKSAAMIQELTDKLNEAKNEIGRIAEVNDEFYIENEKLKQENNRLNNKIVIRTKLLETRGVKIDHLSRAIDDRDARTKRILDDSDKAITRLQDENARLRAHIVIPEGKSLEEWKDETEDEAGFPVYYCVICRECFLLGDVEIDEVTNFPYCKPCFAQATEPEKWF